VLGPSEGRLSGQDARDRYPASGRKANPSGANSFFADVYSHADASKALPCDSPRPAESNAPSPAAV